MINGRPSLRVLATRTRQQYGFTLVELMVAMTVGLFLTAGVLQLYSGNRQSYRVTEALSSIQENGRFILDYLGNEIRPAGHRGICMKPVNNLLNTAVSAYTADRFDLTEFVKGWDNGNGDDPDVGNGALANYVANTDVLMIKHAATPAGLTATAPATSASQTIGLTAPSGQGGAIMVIADPFGCDLFQNTASDADASLSADSGGGSSPDNAGGNFSQEFRDNMEILALHSRQYFIATSDGRPALWERRFDKGSYEDMRLAEGVQDMQITYGLDTNNDKRIDSYSSSPTNWTQVAAVKIDLLLVSDESNLAESAMSLPFNDGEFVAADRRLYQVFSTTIGLRNRIL